MTVHLFFIFFSSEYFHMHPSDFQNLFLMGFVFMNIGDNGWGNALFG